MGLSDKMNHMAGQMQEGIKTTSKNIFSLCLRFITGLVLGFTFGLIAQQIMGTGSFSVFLFTVTTLGVFMKISQTWSIGSILIFDLICVLVGLSLRMYILLAP